MRAEGFRGIVLAALLASMLLLAFKIQPIKSGTADWKFNAISVNNDGTPGEHDWHCYDNFEYGMFWQGDKDVGITTAAISADPHYATVTLENVYPCYFTSISVYPHNIGTVPIKIDSAIISSAYESVTLRAVGYVALDCNGDNKPDIEIMYGDSFGIQLDPNQTPDPEISFWVHVLHNAPWDTTLSSDIEIVAVTWSPDVLLGGGAEPAVWSTTIKIHLIVQTMRSHVSISPIYQSGLSGENLDYIVTVTNFGNVEDNYELTATDDASWTLTLSDNLLENMQAGENRTTKLWVTIPDNVIPCTIDVITVTATSQTDNTISYDSCIARCRPENVFTLDLSTGWNLVCFTAVGENDIPNNILAGLTYYIWKWDVVAGKYVSPPSDQPVEIGVSYWIWVKGDCLGVFTTGTLPDKENIYLVAGWNLVGFPVTSPDTTPANLFTGQTYYIWKWDAENKKYVSPSSAAPVELGVGYWIWVDHDQSVTVP